MIHHSFKVPRASEPCEARSQFLANHLFEHPQTLLEMPLILIPEDLFQQPEAIHHHIPCVHSALNTWITQATYQDECLRIERQWIPFAETYLPDTKQGRLFFNIANTIGNIPIESGVIPKNQDQGYWLKTLHHFYQARGILFAYKLLGIIPNPTSEHGIFTQHLSTSNIRNLEQITTVDIAEYQLIRHGRVYLQKWAETRRIPYPFQRSLDLLFDIAKQAFLATWDMGPNSQEIDWVTIEQQQDLLAVRIRLLEQTPWLNEHTHRKTRNQRGTYQEQTTHYQKFLMNAGWYGRLILSLRPHSTWSLEQPWTDYTHALRQGKLAYLDDFYWRSGDPYRSREIAIDGNPLQSRKTASHQRVQGTTNALGYILWTWA